MSTIHVQRIKKSALSRFKDFIDTSDISGPENEQWEKNILSRCLASFTLSGFCDVSDEIAAESITDGFGDNGLDAIYIDNVEKSINLVQSKWNENGTGSISMADWLKYQKGIEDLVNNRFDNFNEKIKSKRERIFNAIHNAEYNLVLLISYTGTNDLSQEVREAVDSFILKMNDTSEIFEFHPCNQKKLYEILLAHQTGEHINIEEIQLNNWGKHEHPYESFFGEINAETVAHWWERFGTRMLAKNLRKFKGKTNVNDSMRLTLQNSPEDFWYFNNGITILCDSIKKSPAYSPERNIGIFKCTNASIVNGAQTFGSIGESYKAYPDMVKNAGVFIRFIQLENTPDGYANKITRYNNTQNKIENKDFVSLDPIHENIRRELVLDDVVYAYKSGDIIKNPVQGFTVEDATIALSCANTDVDLSTMSKRELGLLWEDIKSPPYTSLFNTSLKSTYLWRLVRVYRIINESLVKYQIDKVIDDKILTTIHGNRLVTHIVLQRIEKSYLHDERIEVDTVADKLKSYTEEIVSLVDDIIKKKYPSDYPNSLFKNIKKCKTISENIKIRLGIEKTLFPE